MKAFNDIFQYLPKPELSDEEPYVENVEKLVTEVFTPKPELYTSTYEINNVQQSPNRPEV